VTGPPPSFSDEYYHNADLRIVQAVPPGALSILDIAAGQGRLGEVLKHVCPGRTVVGVTTDDNAADVSAGRLDRVFFGDIENDAFDLAPQSFDAIVADDVLARCASPHAVLERLRPLLQPGGCLIASLPNMQHWSIVDRLLRGDLQRQDEGLLSRQHRHYFAVSNIIKLFLDAGYLPRIVDRRSSPSPAQWLERMHAASTRQGLDQATFAARAQTWQYFIEARPIANLPAATSEVRPLTVGACTNDQDVLRDNLLASPCLQAGHHEMLLVQDATSAADGLNAIIGQAQHELIVLAHQDVYLPIWWIARLWQQYEQARHATGDRVGVMGVYGVRGTPHGIERSGRVADRDFLLNEPAPLPSRVSSLDELVLVIPRDTTLRFDPTLGFHLYGTDICLEAEKAGLQGIVIDAPCHHNSRQGDELPAAFEQSKAILREKWISALPLATPCTTIC
jgi:SAM-dependent methyltransferase